MGVRSRAKKGSFRVESKWFDVEVVEQKARCKPRLWKGKEESPRGLGWDRRALDASLMVWFLALRLRDLVYGKGSGWKVGGPTLWCGIKIRGVFFLE